MSTTVVGGIGGMERSVYEICRALPDAAIEIYATQVISEGFVPSGDNVRIGDLDEWSRARTTPTLYDIYLQFRAAPTAYLLDGGVKARVRLLIPCGHPTGGTELVFDHVLSEANDGLRYVKLRGRNLTLAPPVTRVTTRSTEVDGLPSRYYLTVFNPYGIERRYSDGLKPCKGHDVLYSVSPRLKTPIVWVYSDVTLGYPEGRVRKAENLISKRNLSQEEIFFLYEHAAGYVSFSREEGFGWSVADAMLEGLRLYSRYVGVLTLFDRDTKGFHLYESGDELVRLLNESDGTERIVYPTDVFEPDRFRRALLELLQKSGPS